MRTRTEKVRTGCPSSGDEKRSCRGGLRRDESDAGCWRRIGDSQGTYEKHYTVYTLQFATQRSQTVSATIAEACDQLQPDGDHRRHHTASERQLRWLVGGTQIGAGHLAASWESSLAQQIAEEGLKQRIALRVELIPF